MNRVPLIALFVLAASMAPAQGVGVGTRLDFTTTLGLNNGTTGQFAQLFIPDYFVSPVDGQFTLVVHLHSASWAAENEVYRAHANAVLFNIHLGGFSSSYQSYFSNQSNFQRILDSVVAVLHANAIIAQPVIQKLVLTSFSAGYAGVREIFKSPAYSARINALTLADGLHCNSDSATMHIQMQDFLRFARDARDRRKVFLLTHSSILTSGYENTTATGDYLIRNIGAARSPHTTSDEIGTQYSRCDTGYFRLKGYFGDTATDHLKHLYAMHLMLNDALRLLDSAVTGVGDVESEPDGFRLEQNFPNPFNPKTQLGFRVANLTFVSLKVFDLLGREIATLVDEIRPAGSYSVEWNGENTSSGVYFYRLQAKNFSSTRTMQLLK